jgi:hypothetical protein
MVGLGGLLWGWWRALKGCELDTVTGFLHARGPTTDGFHHFQPWHSTCVFVLCSSIQSDWAC